MRLVLPTAPSPRSRIFRLMWSSTIALPFHAWATLITLAGSMSGLRIGPAPSQNLHTDARENSRLAGPVASRFSPRKGRRFRNRRREGDARTSGDAGVPATRQIRAHRFRATVARRVLINPPENARETRSSRETSSSIRSSSRRRNPRASRDVSIGSRGKRRLAGEESLNRIREFTLRDAELFLGIPLAHRYAFPLEGLVIDGDRERRPDLVDSSIASPDRPGVVVEGCDPFSHGRPQGLGPFRDAVLVDEREHRDRDGGIPAGNRGTTRAPLG